MKASFGLKLYSEDVASTVLVEDLTSRQSGLRFSTKLNGGFFRCSFAIDGDEVEAWKWLTERMYYRLRVEDVGTPGDAYLAWEGRFQDLQFNAAGIRLVFYGYYASCKDEPYNTAYNAVASAVIAAALTAAAPAINADHSNIDATDITITSAAGDDYLDISVQKLIEKLMEFSTSTQQKLYFAIWENRIPFLKARDVSVLDWRMDLKDLQNFNLTYRASEMFNSSYAIYDAAGLVRTAVANDAPSIAKFGITRQFVVDNLGTVALAAANAQRNAAIAEKKDLWPTLENVVLNDRVFDALGKGKSSSRVRAGDVIRIRDLVPVSTDVDDVTRDALRTFYILGTEYDADLGTNRLTLDTENVSITRRIALKLPK